MLHRIQQLGIDPGQPRQGLRIQAIVFFAALPDQPWRAFATITSCPKSLSKRLIQGECVPISSAIRLRGMVPNAACRALGVLETFCSITMRPLSSKTQ
jgi:hypothetical protein